ncbi:MAG: helix-turn-helix transcriptional regulator [bacterium]
MNVYDSRYQEFIRRLRKARQHAGFSQAQAAKLLNRQQTYVSKSELGERRVDVIEALEFAKLYKKSVASLTNGLLGKRAMARTSRK